MAAKQVELEKIQRTVSFFQRSTKIAHILETAINNVSMRRNSTYGWVVSWTASGCLLHANRGPSRTRRLPICLTKMWVSQSVIEMMKPLKTITKILSTETTPSFSMIPPIKTMTLKSMEQNDDTPAVREIFWGFSCSALDPRHFLTWILLVIR